MKMRFNLRRGLVVQLSLCLGIVLLLAFVASVAPAGASDSCPTQCLACEKDPTINPNPTYETIYRCSPICRILWKGQMTTVYIWYSQVCTITAIAQKCTPQTLCTSTGNCESGTPNWDPTYCKGPVRTCAAWTQMPQGVRYGACGTRPGT